jgi:hypothetical protein
MSNDIRKNIKSTAIRKNFTRDFKKENNKLFLRNLLLLIFGLIFVVYILLPKNIINKNSSKIDTLKSAFINKENISDTEILSKKNISKTIYSKTIKSYSNSPEDVFGNFKTSFENQKTFILSQSQQQNDILFDFQDFKIKKINNVIVTTLIVKISKNGYSNFRVVINPIGNPKESLINTLTKNLGSILLTSQTLDGFEYHLISLK